MKFFILLFGGLILASCGRQIPVIEVEGGLLSGVTTQTDGVVVYKGIPYAAPPVGELRWREPQPVIPWEGVRAADAFGAAAMQSDQSEGGFYQREFFRTGDLVRSEDCLYLNVWTPAAGDPEAKLPVAVWIHGGSYIQGCGHEIEFDGEEFARRGVILVTINYRLGIFGFLAHPLLSAEDPNSVSGNYGILDQCAALTWVHDNIGGFGGDPDNITVFGQDAGVGGIQGLLALSECRGAITRAIMQSGSLLRNAGIDPYILSDAEKVGRELMDFVGFETLEAMRSVSADSLCRLPDRFLIANRYAVSLKPHTDEQIGDFSAMVRDGRLPDIPYLVGYVDGDSKGMKDSVVEFSRLLDKQGRRPAYVYRFSRRLPGDTSGAFHSAELWYLFGTLGRSWRPFTDQDKSLSNSMIDYWTNFIKTGNPNGEGLDTWVSCTNANPEIFILNTPQQFDR